MQIAMIDIDNTISKTNEYINLKHKQFNEDIYPYPLPIDFFEKNPDVFSEADPYVGAAEKLSEFLEAGNRLFYVTAREPWTKTTTEIWLKKHGFPVAPRFFTRNKREVARIVQATLCIDDSPAELNQLIDLVRLVVPAHKYNVNYENRFSEWSTLDPSLQQSIVNI